MKTKDKLTLVLASILFAQGMSQLKVGVNNLYGDPQFEEQIELGNINYLDAVEYELLGLLKSYAEKSNLSVSFIKVPQDQREEFIRNGEVINSLLFSFSYTPERKAKNIRFSAPYLQNRAIAAISNNKGVDVESWNESTVRVGYLRNTTAETEIKKLRNDNYENLLPFDFSNQGDLIKALKDKKIDLAVGDLNRLLYEVNNSNIYFAGNLPTKRSKIADDYCIAVSDQTPELVAFFNLFLQENEKRIDDIRNKYFKTTIDDAYGQYYGKSKEELKNSLDTLKSIFLSTTVILFAIIGALVYWNRKLLRKTKQKEIEALEKGLQEVIGITKLKMDNILDDEGIVKTGIRMFETAHDSIHYYGSGGFMTSLGADKKGDNARLWSDAIKNVLVRNNYRGKPVEFVRVVDLPEVHFNDDLEKKTIVDRNNLVLEKFTAENNYSKYLQKYHRWLFHIYAQLIKYGNLTLINSASAGLWGFGMIFIIKDESEVLLFISSERGEKIGTYIPSPELAQNLKEKYQTEKIGHKLAIHDFTNKSKGFFFGQSEKQLLKDIERAKGDLDAMVSMRRGDRNKVTLEEKIAEFCKTNYS